MNPCERILGLPQREVDPEGAPLLEGRYSRPSGTMVLRPLQRWALAEMELAGGLLGALPVGTGKTLVAQLAPAALRATRPLLLLPARLKQQYLADYAHNSRHFFLPKTHVMTHSGLSTKKNTGFLSQYMPDLIVVDEAHAFRNPNSARTMRLTRYMNAHPDTMFVALSGTMVSNSVRDFAHLADWALGAGSPLPRPSCELNSWLASWANVLDMGSRGSVPGDRAAFAPIVSYYDRPARESFALRFTRTCGVITSPGSGCDATLTVTPVPLTQSPEIVARLKHLDEAWEIEGGRQYDDPMQVAEAAEQLSQGFFYRWVWPSGAPDVQWLEARSAWCSAVRKVAKLGIEGLDSPALVWDAALEGFAGFGRRVAFAAVLEALPAWREVKGRPEPPTVPVWLDSRVVDVAEQWLRKRSHRTVWYRHRAVADALANRGLPVFYAGESPTMAPRSCVCSIRAHGTGTNMQGWSEGLVLCPPASGKAWEQLLGRLHRTGQKADLVAWYWLDSSPRARQAMRKSKDEAAEIQILMQQPQRLAYAAELT